MRADDFPRYKRPVSEESPWSRGDLPASLLTAIDAAVDKKGRCPVVLRMTELAGYTDWVLLVSGRSERHVQGITDGIVDALARDKIKPIGTDGLTEHTWDLLDYDDFLVHVFFHPVRTFYDLEKMWTDAPRVPLGLPAEVFDESDLHGLIAPDPMPDFRGTTEFGGFADEFDDDPEGPPAPASPAATREDPAATGDADHDALFDE